MKINKYKGYVFSENEPQQTSDFLIVEAPLQININNKPFTITMRTPDDDEALIVGLFHAEDVLEKHYIPTIDFSEKNNMTVANLTVPKKHLGTGYLNSRTLLSVASCGICGKTQLDDFTEGESLLLVSEKIKINLLQKMFSLMENSQHSFKISGGCHSAAAFTLNGELLSIKEDIGRHNAVDKVVGDLIIKKKLNKTKVLTVSGRVSYEIIIKCFKATIPFLAAVSAPSSLSVDYAKELGITLFGFCREDRASCYANHQHVLF